MTLTMPQIARTFDHGSVIHEDQLSPLKPVNFAHNKRFDVERLCSLRRECCVLNGDRDMASI